MSAADDHPPNYDVAVDADQLISDLVEQAVAYARDYEEKRQWWQESLDWGDEWPEARYWMLEARGGQQATSEAIAALQPETHSVLVENFRNPDGTVDVRGYLRWLSKVAEDAHDRAGNGLNRKPAPNEAETAYTRVISLLRDEYGVGWPRFDDLGGVLECDLP